MIVKLLDNVTPVRIGFFKAGVRIIVQPVAPNPVRVATSRSEALNVVGGNPPINDGIQVNPSANNTDIFNEAWTGELWVIGVNAAGADVIILTPGAKQS